MSLEIENLTNNEMSKPNENFIIDDSTLLNKNNEPLIDVAMSDLSSNTPVTSPLYSPIYSDQLLDFETPMFFETSNNNHMINSTSSHLLDLDLPTSDLKIDVILSQSNTNENSKENRYSHSLLNRLKRMSVINTIDKELLLLEENATEKLDNEMDANKDSQNLLEFDENVNDLEVKFDELETEAKISAEIESSIVNTESQSNFYLETELAQVSLLNSNISESNLTAQYNEKNSDLLDETKTSIKDIDLDEHAKELKLPLKENPITESKINKFLIDKHEQSIAEKVYMEQKAVTPVDFETILNRNKSLGLVTKLFQAYDEAQPPAGECNIEATAVVVTNNETQIETKTLPKKKTCIIS